jgi:asparagine synthase (glutamine-hydrolysing)
VSAIFGLISASGGGLFDRELLQMRSALAARGGDGSSTWTAEGVGLGHELKRVTPQDLAERQPLVSGDGLRALVSAGRIDNRRELSGELGLPWESPRVPDSAFILAAYEQWGEDCARHLIGSFSFAIWDERRSRLLLARSPFGARPVFYHQSPEFTAFATMPKALFALAGVPRQLNPQTIADMLILVPPEPGTSPYHDIRSLEPGHLAVADRQGCSVRAFWQPELGHELRLGRDEEYVDAFTELFDRVVEDQLRSIHPVGVLLSGGLGSTSVAATAAPLLAKRGERLTAFTGAPRPGFGEPGAPDWLTDEAPLAGAVADRYENLDLSVRRGQGLFLDGLDRYLDAAEMPCEPAAGRVWSEGVMAQAQAQGIGVLLTGTCGNLTVSWPGGGRPSAAGKRARAGLITRLPYRVQLAITRRRGSDRLPAREDWWSPLSPIRPEFAREQRVAERSRARGCDRWPARTIDTPAGRLRRLLHDGQRLSGASGAYSAMYGVDIRDPTADARIVELCLSLPEDQCARRGVSRSLIRRAMADRLPAHALAGGRHGADTTDWFERLSGARATVDSELRLLDGNETARALLDLPRMRRLADNFDAPAADPYQRMLDYRYVLGQGLMMGRFIRWFDDGRA